ncbi:MAG: hypothetical protein N2595_06005 [bacterium]|nr:hypothetical protein [bacterium]
MTPRARVHALIAGVPVERCAFWLGCPPQEIQATLHTVLGSTSLEELLQFLGDNVCWIGPQHFASTYSHPAGMSMRPW